MLDARLPKKLTEKLVETEATLAREISQLEGDSDDEDGEDQIVEDDDDDENSGSESVHDYFSYSTSYPQNFMNIQTLPINLQGAKR